MFRPPRLLALLTILLACGVVAPIGSSSAHASAPGKRLIVSFSGASKRASTVAALAQAGFVPYRSLDCANAMIVTAPAGATDASIAKLSAMDGVESVEDDDTFVVQRPADAVRPLPRPHERPQPNVAPKNAQRPSGIPDDEYFTYQWNLQRIDAPTAWDYTTGATDTGSIVAILDSGVDADHPDLAGRIFTQVGYNFVDNNTDTTDRSPVGSGTQIAGIIAATADNGAGIAGLTWNGQVIPIKVLGYDPQYNGDVGRWGDVIAGICHAVAHNAQVIHVGVFASKLDHATTLRRALDSAVAAGAVVVAPGGDEWRRGNPTEYPAAFSTVISVSAVTQNDDAWAESSAGSYISIAAPGVDVPTTLPMTLVPDGYALVTGSNVAAAHISGVALLMKAVNPGLKAAQVRDVLRQSADDVGLPGPDFTFGAGIVNAKRAVLNTPHMLTVAASDPLTFQWDEASQQYRQPSLSITNRNTSALTWKAVTDVDWLQLAAPQGPTPSQVAVTPLPPTTGECGTLTASIKAESTMPRQADGAKDVLVRVYLPDCPPLPYHVHFPLMNIGQ
ncbi:MAG: S8 family serine peptidase [Anaerolineae bacterium]